MSEFIDSGYLQQIASDIIKKAMMKGADQAEVSIGRSESVSINVRKQELETFEQIQNQSASIQIYLNHKKAQVNTSDFSNDAIEKSLDAAFNIAKYTDQDPDFALADRELLAFDYPSLKLDFRSDASCKALVKTAIECEAAALDYDSKISNSEGAALDNIRALRAYANSHGFNGAYTGSRYSLSCAVIAGKGQNMQQNYHYTVNCNPEKLEAASKIGKIAAKKTIAKLNPEAFGTGKYPVIFDASIAAGLFGNFIRAISGSSLYKNLSFLPDSINTQIFPDFICLKEQPHLSGALGSAPFDAEGVKTQNRNLVDGGIVKSYVLGSYSARKLGMQSTGNAGGIRNLVVNSGQTGLKDLFKTMNNGIYVTGLMGHGVNSVTGDYSQGAYGFLIENGEIQNPVDKITIAGNLKQMYKNIVQIASDIDYRHNIQTGSVLVEALTISGNK